MKFSRWLIGLCLILCTPISMATSWETIEVADPILAGQSCVVRQPTSYGEYVYEAASKYDQVFWPLTDVNGIWVCAGSGFAAFIGDFSNLQAEEVTRVTQYLEDNPVEQSTMLSVLARLEDIYSLRNSDATLRNKLDRVLARWYQNLGQLDKANRYRGRALAFIEQRLADELLEPQRLEYLYVAANYSRQFGKIEASDKYLAQLNLALAAVSNTQLLAFRDYLQALAKQTPNITPGGALDPVLPE